MLKEIVDGRGKKTILTGPVKRIVSLVPSDTEILFALGLGDRVVGVTEHCDFPPTAAGLPKIGFFARPDPAKVVSLRPDLVLAEMRIHRRLIEELEGKGLTVYAFSPGRLAEVFGIMDDMAVLAGEPESGSTVTAALRERVNRFVQTLPDYSPPRVFRLMRDNPVITPGPLTFQYEAIALAGGEQMNFADTGDAYIQINWEELRDFDPQVILFCGRREEDPERPRCKGCTVDNPPCWRVAKRLFTGQWQELSAVRAGLVVPTPCNMLCRPGPRLVDGIEKLHEILINKED